MTTRLLFAATAALFLGGCATYSNDYRDPYADGSYYSPAEGDNGDYYYAPERPDTIYYDGYYGGSSYYDYRYYLGPIGYGSFDGYCSVRYSTCAPYWYGGYSPSFSRFGFSLLIGSYGGYDRGYYRQPYYGYGYRTAPIYRDRSRHVSPPGQIDGQQPQPNWNASPGGNGRPRTNRPGYERDPGRSDTPPGVTSPRPLNPETGSNSNPGRPMPKPGFEADRPYQPAPRPAYREPRLEPRLYREPAQQAPPAPRPGYRELRVEPRVYREPAQQAPPAPRPGYRESRVEPRVYREPAQQAPRAPRQEPAPARQGWREDRSSSPPPSQDGAPVENNNRRKPRPEDGG